MFNCLVCKRNVPLKNADKHPSSKGHLQALERDAKRAARTQRATSTSPKTSFTPQVAQRTSPRATWHCNECDRDIAAFFKERHLKSKAHTQRISPRTSSTTALWHCDCCNKDIKIASKPAHLKSKKHVRRASVELRGAADDRSKASVATDEEHRAAVATDEEHRAAVATAAPTISPTLAFLNGPIEEDNDCVDDLDYAPTSEADDDDPEFDEDIDPDEVDLENALKFLLQ
jgi:hypothetical protein